MREVGQEHDPECEEARYCSGIALDLTGELGSEEKSGRTGLRYVH